MFFVGFVDQCERLEYMTRHGIEETNEFVHRLLVNMSGFEI
jgi:hypothetical protein